MKWLYFILAVLVFIHFFRSISGTLLIFQSQKINKYPKILNILLIWLLPYYWIYKIRKDIKKNHEIRTDYSMDFPNEFYVDDW
jgi:hypothetical protein